MNDPMKILSVQDVAKYLQVDEQTVIKLVASGDIPSFDIDGIPRIQFGALIRWFQDKSNVKSIEHLRELFEEPSSWRNQLEANPELKEVILSTDWEPETMGSFLKAAIHPTTEYQGDFRISSPNEDSLTPDEREELLREIDLQKALMIAVATGGPRIDKVNEEYIGRRRRISALLEKLGIEDPNPYSDLWVWYGKWRDGTLPSYQSRREYIAKLYQPLADGRFIELSNNLVAIEPTGWIRVDRGVDRILELLKRAENEEDYQSIALMCREVIISLAQALYDDELHRSLDGTKVSDTDAKRMIEAYLATVLTGSSFENHRRFAKASYDLTNAIQHRRTATFRDAALCAEATRSLANTLAILAGERNHAP